MKTPKNVKILVKSPSLFLLLSILLIQVIVNTEIVEAQPIEDRYEITVTLEEPSSITSGIAISELDFTVDYQMTALVSFSQVANISLMQGLLGHYFDHQPTDVWIRDNLGNEFTPIINNTKIETPLVTNITIQPYFEYRITLHFKITEPKFDNHSKQFILFYGLETASVPLTISFRLPKEYEVFQDTTSNIVTDSQHTKLNWNFAEGEQVKCAVVFLPFSLERNVKAMGIVVDIPIYDDSTSLKETLEMSFELPSVVMIWNATINIPVKIPFPSNSTTVKVESVFDGQGECKPLDNLPINTTQESQLGHFFVDNKNKLVWIFPRHSYQDRFAQLEVKVTFIVPNIIVGNRYNIPAWQPYTGYAGMIFNFTESSSWKIDLTSNFEVKFILPSDVEFIASIPEENVLYTIEDNRPTVSFVYNSPVDIPENEWLVIFDNIALRNFNIQQLITIILFVLPCVFLFVAYKFVNTKWKLAFFEGLPLAIVTYRVIDDSYQFLTLPTSDSFFLFYQIIELTLLSITLGASLFIFIKKESRAESTSRFEENPFVSIFYKRR